MAYDAPGRADELTDELRERWNEAIQRAYEEQEDLRTRFFSLDPAALRNPRRSDAFKWPGDPGKPAFCVGEEMAQKLSDWGLTGRGAVQLEYCEYAILSARDGTGALRPKRVEVTTEFREWWSIVAMYEPDRVRAMATEVLGFEPDWSDLYGVADPQALTPGEREIAFGHTVAGHGNDSRLIAAGVPAQPTGRLNRERALFMTHPINGLDDIVYVVVFGANPYALRDGDGFVRPTGNDIFTAAKVSHLACNHSDPTVSLGVHDVIFDGRQVAFENPLGMYIREPNAELFSYRGGALPADWIRMRRGAQGLHMRLEFGPPDEHEAFLDDITVSVGASDRPLTGGYQLLRELEIGPRLLVGEADPVLDDEWQVIDVAPAPIACNEAASCRSVRELAARYEAAHAGAVAPRAPGPPAAGLMALQEGIYHRPGKRPGRFFALLFLRADPALAASAAGAELGDLWAMYQGLKAGRVRDLPGVQLPDAGADAMTVLLGYGRNAFGLDGVARPRPRGLGDEYLFRSALAGGGGPLLRGSGLAYAPEVTANKATEAFCVQVIADSKLAVDRAVVETWKALADRGGPGLSLTTFYLGFQRNDRRSWIDFHDGLSNLRSADREAVIAIDPGGDEDWAVGGTYLAFMRLGVDLVAWRGLDRRDQELAVGRDKLSGCPITGVGADGEPLAAAGCPVAGTQIWENANDDRFAEPPETADPVVRASHVQRANHHHRPAGDSGSRRIFRQGYEFLEWAEGAPGFRAGLNFVSFQDTPARVLRMLTLEGWLGDTNFGGDAASLLSVFGAGVYFVAPVAEGEAFPGAGALGV